MLPHGLLGIPAFLLVLPFVVWVSFRVFLKGVRRSHLDEHRALLLQLLVAVAALAGAKAFSLLFEWGWNPFDPGTEEAAGGWRYPGGLFGLVIAIALLKPRLLPGISLARYLDLVAPPAAVAVGLLRLHCVLQGCCVGEVCQQFYCLSYAPGSEVATLQAGAGVVSQHAWSLRVLPLHLLLMAASLSVGWFLWWFDPRRIFDGQVFLLYLVLHESAKFGLEQLRDPPSLLLQLSSLAPAIIALAVLAAVLVRRRAAGPLGS